MTSSVSFRIGLVTSAILLSSIASFGNTISLGFTSLPSAQGWSFGGGGISCPLPESTLYSVSGGALHQNTLGCGGGFGSNTSGAGYQLNGVIASSQPFTIAVRTRVTAENTFYGGSVSHTGLGFGAEVNGKEYFIALGGGTIFGVDGSTNGFAGRVLSNSIDTTQYHSYLLSVGLGGAYTLSVDNTAIASGGGVATSPTVNDLFFGDASSRANAQGDYASYVFRQGSVVTPEPCTLALLGTGMLGLVWRRRRKAA